MSKIVKIGHLTGDENGKARGGKPGDQTGKESRIQEWYDGNWDFMLRCSDKKVAETMAKTMEDICNNPYAGGYDQGDRTTLDEMARKHNWHVDEITKDEACEADCSSGVAVCINAGFALNGINKSVSKDMYTGNERKVLEATGYFKAYTSSKYIDSPDKLKRGDVLLRENGHTCIVTSVTDAKPKEVKASKSATEFSKKLSGTYVTTSDLNIRDGAGTDNKILVTVPKGTEVTNYGYYSIASNGRRWYYVAFTYKNVNYNGVFASSAYLKKK